mmetsp:Transcript_372/g.1174  ORF Transcript_372/g.1174 Transcript_372/m.1174 type:complete len:231 (+) Transcript_372:637-1329(+)
MLGLLPAVTQGQGLPHAEESGGEAADELLAHAAAARVVGAAARGLIVAAQRLLHSRRRQHVLAVGTPFDRLEGIVVKEVSLQRLGKVPGQHHKAKALTANKILKAGWAVPCDDGAHQQGDVQCPRNNEHGHPWCSNGSRRDHGHTKRQKEEVAAEPRAAHLLRGDRVLQELCCPALQGPLSPRYTSAHRWCIPVIVGVLTGHVGRLLCIVLSCGRTAQWPSPGQIVQHPN